jgi:hypothetical protein
MPIFLLKLIALVGTGIGVGLLGQALTNSNQHKDQPQTEKEK